MAAERPSSFSYEDLIASGEGRLHGPGNAQLPLPPMLMFDRITSMTAEGGVHGKGQVVAEYDITPERWFFECHFRGDPVMPGCLGLDAMWQLTGFYMAWAGSPGRGRALGVGEVEFRGQITPFDGHKWNRSRTAQSVWRAVSRVCDPQTRARHHD